MSEVHNHYTVNSAAIKSYGWNLAGICDSAGVATDRAWLLARIEAHTNAIKELQDHLDGLNDEAS